MKKISILGISLFVLSTFLLSQTIDHNSINLDAIPSNWIDSAKANLNIGYGHTSHGSQITSGMNAIEKFYTDGTYDWSHTGGSNELQLFEGSGSSEGYLDHDIGYSGWDDETREYLDSFPDCNVIIWSWCGQVNSVNLQTHLFDQMELLESEYPDVTFVYMTGHLEGLGSEGSIFTANQQIRNYCTTNDKFLFDFTDIEKYDPDGLINYQEFFVDDECDYDPDGESPVNRSQNWADNWLTAHPTHELTQISSQCSSCAHSVSLNCVKKGIAAWHLWARLAGWDGGTGGVIQDTIKPSTPQNLSSTVFSSSRIDLSWDVSTDNIAVTGYKVIRNGEEVASISSTSYSNIGLSSDTEYDFYIQAYDKAGNLSDTSLHVLATTKEISSGGDTICPSVPQNLSANVLSESQIDLSWDASTDNVAVFGYKIIRNGAEIATVLNTSYSNTGLQEETEYDYCVFSYDEVGNISDSSIHIKATTLEAIHKPTNILAGDPIAGAYVFPNPASDNIWITLDNEANYSIIDLTGKTILSGKTSNIKAVDISSVSKGIYFIRINEGKKYSTVKLIKN